MSKVALIRTVLLAASATGLAACGGPAPEDGNADANHAPHCRLLNVDGEDRLFCDPTDQQEQELLAAPGSGTCGSGSGSDSCVDNGMGCSASCWNCTSGWGSGAGTGTGCNSGGGSQSGGNNATACEYWPGFSKTASGAANGMDLEATRAQACSNAANNAANACSGYGVLCTSYSSSVSTGQGNCFFGPYNVPQQASSYDCWCSATASCRYR